jgi:hypothetical protein
VDLGGLLTPLRIAMPCAALVAVAAPVCILACPSLCLASWRKMILSAVLQVQLPLCNHAETANGVMSTELGVCPTISFALFCRLLWAIRLPDGHHRPAGHLDLPLLRPAPCRAEP